MIDKATYIKNKGLTCPFCGAGPVEGGFIQFETGFAFQRMSCTECGGSWQDVYQLINVIPNRKERLWHTHQNLA